MGRRESDTLKRGVKHLVTHMGYDILRTENLVNHVFSQHLRTRFALLDVQCGKSKQ
jgi:hypothetical protein